MSSVLNGVRAALDAWLGEPRWKRSEGRITLNDHFLSEDVPPPGMQLRVEINSREHFTVVGHETVQFEVESRWFTGRCDVHTFSLDELLGTKLRDEAQDVAPDALVCGWVGKEFLEGRARAYGDADGAIWTPEGTGAQGSRGEPTRRRS